MNSSQSGNPQNLLTLQEAAQALGVTPDVLLLWNEHNILKPTITQSGKIGYSKNQIDQFSSLRQLQQQTPNFRNEPLNERTQASQNTQVPMDPYHNIPPASYSSPRQNTLNEFSHSTTSAFSNVFGLKNLKIPAYVLSSFVGFLFVALALAALIQQGGFTSLFNHFQASSSQQIGSGTSTSSLTLPGHVVFVLPVQSKNNNGDETIKTGDESAFKNRVTTLHTQEGTPSSGTTLASREAGQVPVVAYKTTNSGLEDSVGTDNMNAITTYASTATPCQTCTSNQNSTKNSVIDENGNIIGEVATPDELATLLGGVSTPVTNNSFTQAGLNVQNPELIFLIIILFAGIFVVPRQLAYGFKNAQNNHTELSQKQMVTPQQKILEVEQKMDGAVIVYFQGQEFRVSKPELFSESDRFIERLMSLSSPDTKEIEYDSFKDQKITFTTPLSRIVTRLGFVGIKRDLFFPRTSKDRVLFRRFVTREDLRDMNLTTEQLMRDLANIPASKHES